jgi:hypothetical protein
MRNQNLNVTPTAAALQVTVLVAVLFGLLAMLAHNVRHTSIEPASFAGETMPIVQFP